MRYALLALAGCSLGLDHSKIDIEAGAMDVSPPMDASPDGPPSPNPDKCKEDTDCKPNDPCISKGTCDKARGVCVYQVCPTTSCNVSICDGMTKSCGVPMPIAYHAGQFKVGNSGCGGNARRCFAVVHPFVFIGTTSGVVAYPVIAPTQTPAAIQVGGVPFLPQFIVSSGTRVYFVGAVVGVMPMFRMPIAWVETPGDPTVKSIAAQTAFLSVSVPGIDRVYPTDDGGIFLVQESASASFPTAKANAPLVDLGDLPFFPSPGVPTNSSSLAASGSRILFGRVNSGAMPPRIFFDFENNAGTSNAQNSGEMEVTMPAGNDVTNPIVVTQGPNGAVMWQAAVGAWPMNNPAFTKGERAFWLVANSSAGIDATQRVDVESYDSMLGLPLAADVVGSIAAVDSDRAFVIAGTSQNIANSNVKVATRTPMPQIVMGKNHTLPFAPSSMAAVSSGGWGYVLTPDPQVHIFAPDCP